MKYLMPGMDEYVEGLILDRRANSFTIKRLLDGRVFNTHAGDIDIKETEQERKELKERLSERRKEFDIMAWHNQRKDIIKPCIEINGDNEISVDGEIDREYSIAFAKYFKLTGEDLK